MTVTALGLLLTRDPRGSDPATPAPSAGEGIPDATRELQGTASETGHRPVVPGTDTSSRSPAQETLPLSEEEQNSGPEKTVDPKRIALSELLARRLERFRGEQRPVDARFLMYTYVAAKLYMQGKGEPVELGEDVPDVKDGRRACIHDFPDGTIQVFYYSEYEFPEAEECIALTGVVPRDLVDTLKARAVEILEWIAEDD